MSLDPTPDGGVPPHRTILALAAAISGPELLQIARDTLDAINETVLASVDHQDRVADLRRDLSLLLLLLFHRTVAGEPDLGQREHLIRQSSPFLDAWSLATCQMLLQRDRQLLDQPAHAARTERTLVEGIACAALEGAIARYAMARRSTPAPVAQPPSEIVHFDDRQIAAHSRREVRTRFLMEGEKTATRMGIGGLSSDAHPSLSTIRLRVGRLDSGQVADVRRGAAVPRPCHDPAVRGSREGGRARSARRGRSRLQRAEDEHRISGLRNEVYALVGVIESGGDAPDLARASLLLAAQQHLASRLDADPATLDFLLRAIDHVLLCIARTVAETPDELRLRVRLFARRPQRGDPAGVALASSIERDRKRHRLSPNPTPTGPMPRHAGRMQ